MKIRIMFLIFCVLVFTPAVFAQVQNGSFEEGINPVVFTNLLAGSTAVSVWQVDSGNIDYIGTHWQAAEGVRSVDMNGFQSGEISQTIASIPGITYQVTFSMSGNPDGNNLSIAPRFIVLQIKLWL